MRIDNIGKAFLCFKLSRYVFVFGLTKHEILYLLLIKTLNNIIYFILNTIYKSIFLTFTVGIRI